MECPTCHEQCDEGSIFCPACGMNVYLYEEEYVEEKTKHRQEKEQLQEEIITLKQSIYETEESNRQANKILKKQTKQLQRMQWWLIAMIGLFIGALITIGMLANYSIPFMQQGCNIETYQTALLQNESLGQEVAALEAFATQIAPTGLYIETTRSYNSFYDENGVWTEQRKLKSEEMRYLINAFNIYTLGDLEDYTDEELFITITRPDGTRSQGSTSPLNHSYSIPIEGDVLEGGWGSNGRSMYEPGLYVVEYYYKQQLVGNCKVIIGQD